MTCSNVSNTCIITRGTYLIMSYAHVVNLDKLFLFDKFILKDLDCFYYMVHSGLQQLILVTFASEKIIIIINGKKKIEPM